MAEPLTTTRFLSAYKILFPEKKLTTYGMEDQPFRAYLANPTDFYGRKAEIPIHYSPGGGGNSPTFADAQATKGSGLYTHFELERRRDYKIISLDAEALEASENDKGAYLEAKKLETEGALTHINQMLGAYLQGDGTGTIGTVSAVSTSNNTFDVGDADIVHFEPGMRAQFAASTFTALRPGILGYVYVSVVDFDNNRITVDTTKGDSIAQSAAAAADRVYAKGAFGLALQGFDAWIPFDRTGLATSFNNVVRSVFPSRLAGIAFDGSSYGLLEAFERAFARARKERCNPESVWLSFNQFANMSLELGAKAIREPVSFGQFAYDSITMNVASRKVRFMCDPNISDTYAKCTTKSTWGFKTLKAAPRFLTRDTGAGDMLVEPASDGFEIRLGWRGNLFCRSPGENMVIKLPT